MERTNPGLSVIVPVYNVERYLKDCIESILNQSYTDYELIIVDDGSCDGSSQICDDYAKADNRVQVIHKKNGGASSARNVGLHLAQGKYVSFIDSDDYIGDDFYKYLINGAEESDADIAIGSVCKVTEDKRPTLVSKLKHEYLTPQSALIKMFDIPATIEMALWNKVYKRKILGDLLFDINMKYSEDLLFNISALKKTIKLIIIPEPVVYIRERSDSAIHTKINNDTFVENLNNIKKCIVDAKDISIDVIDYGEYSMWIRVLNRREQLLADDSQVELSQLRAYIKHRISKLIRNKKIPTKQKCFLTLFALGAK